MELEHKSIKFEIKEIDEKGHFTGTASPYDNIDLGDDRVRSSIAPRNANKTVPYLWCHDVTEPVGTVKLIATNTAMNIDGQLFLDTSPTGTPLIPNAFKAYTSMKNGILSNSIGYQVMPNGAEYVTENGKTIRDLVDIDIKEVSGVLFPMNEQAIISDVKSQNLNGGDNLADDNKTKIEINNSKESASSTRKWGDLDETPIKQAIQGASNSEELAKEACLTLDDGWETNMSKMNYLHHTIKDNVLVVDNIGVQAARERAAQQGIISGDVEKHLKKHYKDLGLKWDKNDIEGEDSGKDDTTDKNKKSDPTKLNVKALGFNAVYQTRQNREARWDAEMALDQSLDSIAQDEDMALEDKLTASNTTIDDFCNMYKQIMAGLISAMAQKSIDYQFETKSVYMERKSGRKISKATKEKIQGCKDSMSNLISILAALCEDDTPDDDTGDEEGDKGCKPKVTGKSQNIQNMKEKENNGTLELKSEELQALEALCNTINEK